MGAATTVRVVYGGFRLDGQALALPLAALREVVPLAALVALPCQAPCVAGALALRGQLLPVIDLLRLGTDPVAAPDPAGCIVIVMAWAGRLLGLRADAVTGLFDCAADAVHAVTVADAPARIFAASLRRPDTGELVRVLDAAAIASLGAVPMVDDPRHRSDGAEPIGPPVDPATDAAADPASAAGVADPDPDRMLLLMRCGRFTLALDSSVVQATLAQPAIEPGPLTGPACLGELVSQGRRVPVVDLQAHCGFGAAPPERLRQAVVLRMPEGLVALAVDAVLDVMRVPTAAVQPVPALLLPRPALFAGVLPPEALSSHAGPVQARAQPQPTQLPSNPRPLSPVLPALGAHPGAAPVAICGAVPGVTPGVDRRGGLALLLDARALLAEADLRGLASLCRDDGEAAAARSIGVAGSAVAPATHTTPRRALITYELGAETASPIEQVAEILPYADGEALFDTSGGPLLGLLSSRGRTIPMLCLQRLVGGAAGAEAFDASASVLVVQVLPTVPAGPTGPGPGAAAHWFGFVVPRLRSIEQTDWEPALPAGPGARAGDAAERRPLAQLGHGAERRLVPVVDLQALAARLIG